MTFVFVHTCVYTCIRIHSSSRDRILKTNCNHHDYNDHSSNKFSLVGKVRSFYRRIAIIITMIIQVTNFLSCVTAPRQILILTFPCLKSCMTEIYGTFIFVVGLGLSTTGYMKNAYIQAAQPPSWQDICRLNEEHKHSLVMLRQAVIILINAFFRTWLPQLQCRNGTGC